jgi:hypothetical protein
MYGLQFFPTARLKAGTIVGVRGLLVNIGGIATFNYIPFVSMTLLGIIWIHVKVRLVPTLLPI